MQSAVTLSQKDIARFIKAVGRLAEIGTRLQAHVTNGHAAPVAKKVVKRRKRREASPPPSPDAS